MTRNEAIEKMAEAALRAQQTYAGNTRIGELVDGLAAIGLLKLDDDKADSADYQPEQILTKAVVHFLGLHGFKIVKA
jgi:hypothetical protein